MPPVNVIRGWPGCSKAMKNVFKDDEKKRAMFERVFPTDVKPEEGSVEPKKRQEEVKPPGE